jgi:nickel-dependent lactate racemase
MSDIQLRYGDASFNFEYDPNRFEVLNGDGPVRALADLEIGTAFDSPIGGPHFDEAIDKDDSVLIVVSDATRATASAQIVNLFVRRLIQAGVSPVNLAIIFATGIHRPVTQAEKADLITPFILQRVRTIDHDAYDQRNLVQLGVTSRGTPVTVNKALQEFPRIVVVGGINFHYFAGFTGGRKSICPGLAAAETIEATHLLALDFKQGGRRAGVGPGLLAGNAVNEECEEIAAYVAPTFGINAIVGDDKTAVAVFCGDWRQAHHAACEQYLKNRSRLISGKRDLVIVSCGGSPHDINLIQAHKAIEMASYACNEGGSIILLAQCRDGLGRANFLQWFDSQDSRSLENRLRDHYEVNGQTAWSLLEKTERFNIHLISDLAEQDVHHMRMHPSPNLFGALQEIGPYKSGYVMPRGAAILPRISTGM